MGRTMNPTPWPPEPIAILLLDVDGTLTDGGLYYSAEGLAMKRFDVRDGLGIVLLQQAGVEVAVVSADDSPVTAARCRKLGIRQVEIGCTDKAERVREILAARRLRPGQACYMGDDLTDLPAFAAGVHAVAPADAVPEVRAAAEYVTSALAGHGAVREVCDLLRAAL
jgi:3-deoxy-D-manno-octulosonate 8-phosphate phosphatase (KDO 8-P phosphatase)